MILKSISLLLFPIAFASCSQDDAAVIQDSPREEIHFTASTYNIQTKAIHTDKTLPKGASVGIFGWGHEKGEVSPLTVRTDLVNAKYTTDNGTNLTSPMHAHFPVAADTVIDFYAYYPYKEEIAIPSVLYKLEDQNDILWATPVMNIGKDDVEKETNGDTAPIAMVFNHTLSAITMVIKKDDQITETLLLENVELLKYATFATLDVKTGKFTATETDNAYPLLQNQSEELTTKADTLVNDYLLWPGEAPTFRFKISNHTYEVKPITPFEPNRRQIYTFTIKAKDISVSASINPWQTGPEGSGEIGI